MHDQEMDDLAAELSPRTFASMCGMSGEGTHERFEGNSLESEPVLPLLPLMIELQDDDDVSPTVIPEFPSVANESTLPLPSKIRLLPRKKIRGCTLPRAASR